MSRRSFAFLTLLCACAPEPPQSASLDHTETAPDPTRTGGDLMHCWAAQEPSTEILCGIAPDAPLPMRRIELDARFGRRGTIVTLTPENPSAVIHYLPPGNETATITAAVHVDGSAVLGIDDDFAFDAVLKQEAKAFIPGEVPIGIPLPFEVWDIELEARNAALLSSMLGAYTLQVNDETLAVEATALPSLSLGERASFKIASQHAALPVAAEIATEDAVTQTRETALVGSGAYFVGPDGIERDPEASLFPMLACWAQPDAETVDLWCQRTSHPAIEMRIARMAFADADNTSHELVVLFQREYVEVLTHEGVVTTTGVDEPFLATRLSALQWPLSGTISWTAASEGAEVIGLGPDAFDQNEEPFELADTSGPESPWQLRLPVELWPVTFVLDEGTPFWMPELTPYTTTVARAWNTHEAGATLQLSGPVPFLGNGDVRRDLLFPVPNEGTITLNVSAAGRDSVVVLDGPGTFVVSETGAVPSE